MLKGKCGYVNNYEIRYKHLWDGDIIILADTLSIEQYNKEINKDERSRWIPFLNLLSASISDFTCSDTGKDVPTIEISS